MFVLKSKSECTVLLKCQLKIIHLISISLKINFKYFFSLLIILSLTFMVWFRRTPWFPSLSSRLLCPLSWPYSKDWCLSLCPILHLLLSPYPGWILLLQFLMQTARSGAPSHVISASLLVLSWCSYSSLSCHASFFCLLTFPLIH